MLFNFLISYCVFLQNIFVNHSNKNNAYKKTLTFLKSSLRCTILINVKLLFNFLESDSNLEIFKKLTSMINKITLFSYRLLKQVTTQNLICCHSLMRCFGQSKNPFYTGSKPHPPFYLFQGQMIDEETFKYVTSSFKTCIFKFLKVRKNIR